MCSQKYATFNGRASRSEFWWWVLANAIVGTVLYLLTLGLGLATASKPGQVIGPAGWPFGILLLLWALGTIVPTIAVSVRRLHDAGYSGWFYLFSIVGLGIVDSRALRAGDLAEGAAVRAALPRQLRPAAAATGNSRAMGSSSAMASSRAMGSSSATAAAGLRAAARSPRRRPAAAAAAQLSRPWCRG